MTPGRRPFRACMSNQAKSVATASRQITWANSWQRISPSVVAILLICPAYIAGTLIVGTTPWMNSKYTQLHRGV